MVDIRIVILNYELNKEENRDLVKIEKTDYMLPTLKGINEFVIKNGITKNSWREVFNHLYEILKGAEQDVRKLLNDRKIKGEITDITQSIKSIAGNVFSNSIVYIFLKNKIIGNIKPNIFITSKKSKVKNFDKLATINVDGETQKPDADLIIYTKKENDDVDKCIILSLKTSLRERAGQTYKWKLLMEIATSENTIKDKYNISYETSDMPMVCFATVNFYNEINNPQHRGMFKFFDKAFISKPVNENFISPLSEIIDFVNEEL